MAELFKNKGLYPGVPVLKKDPKQIAVENPSLWLGFLPVIGGAITTPMQLSEIHRGTVYQSAAQHFLKLIGIRGFRMRGQNVKVNLHETLAMPPHVSFREPHTVSEFLQKRALAQKAIVKYLQAHARLSVLPTARSREIIAHRQREAHRAIIKFNEVNNRLKIAPISPKKDSILLSKLPQRPYLSVRKRPLFQA